MTLPSADGGRIAEACRILLVDGEAARRAARRAELGGLTGWNVPVECGTGEGAPISRRPF